MAEAQILTFDEIANELRFKGRDPKRYVERRFKHHGVDYIPSIGATTVQFQSLLEAMSCSPSANEADTSTAVARSVSARRPASSKSTLQAAVNNAMQRSTGTSSLVKSGRNSLAVLQGGRS